VRAPGGIASSDAARRVAALAGWMPVVIGGLWILL